MRLSSREFKNNEFIPKKFTSQGQGISPSLIIEEIPQQAKSLALIVDDPDATIGTFVHWVVFNISVTSMIKEDSVPGTQGINDSGGCDYVGPCPPSGVHRYFFKIYALDNKLTLSAGVSKQGLIQAMRGHILEQAELIGLYQKKA